ncbi:MAG: zinc ribbon domain-containing protein [Caldimonas sp.]
MTKLCSVCSTENRDEAQFCRSCGTAFPPPAAPSEEEARLAEGIACDECNFQNKPGVRYCANCGVSLLGTVIVPRSRSAALPAEPFTSPPPISYPSYAPVAPYPPPPLSSPSYPPVAATTGYGSAPPPGYPPAYDDPLAAPDLPDPAAEIAAIRRRDANVDDTPTRPPAAPVAASKAPNRAPLVVGLAVVVLLAAAGAAWWFMKTSSGPRPDANAASAPAPMAEPAPATVEPPASAVAAEPVPAASAPEVVAAPPEPSPAAAALPPAAMPAAESASPPVVNADAQRIAVERRQKAARDRADREAKAKALAEQQQQQAAAAARFEQEAARRRAEEAQRAARPVPVAPPPQAPAPVQARGVREICAGRGTIAESICRSRECGSPEHVNEAVCKQQKEIEDRHRN